MAAALIPIVAPLVLTELPKLVDLIVGLIHKQAPVAEASGGPGTGPVKFADVFVAVMNDLAKASASNQIPGIPADGTVKTIIQAVVTSMKLSGVLGSMSVSSPAELPATQGPLVLSAGQSITISVK
jgi:hypothetical protein